MGINLSYRKAEESDAKLVYDWSNEPLVREMSFYSDPIIWENHVTWFEKKRKDLNTQFLIFEFGNNASGLVRIENGEETVIGILIDKNFRGKKLAVEMLKIACAEYWKSNDNHVYAYIKRNNEASLKSFEKAGFNFDRNDCVNGNDCVVLKIEKQMP